ncbi:phage antirepressor protein [Clostridium botulinum C/D str. BKT12695]|nr:phage antirepressor protein [Clostridium botulinum C/D str. BKT12695]
MNNLQVFKNNEFGEVRTIIKGTQPLFLANPLAKILNYSEPAKMLKRLDADEKVEFKSNEVATILGVSFSELGLSKFSPKAVFITESGLYNAILGSEKKEAKKFKRWVTSEVLPSIRKHGMYATDELLDNPDLLIQVATKLKEEKAKNKILELQNKQKEQIIGELKPRADYTDKILKNKGLVTITQIAKDYGMTGTGLNKLLHELKVQYKQSDQWLLYKEHSGKGYTHSETIDIIRSDGRPDIKMNTKWTQKGRLFLYNLLRDKDILPTIEQKTEQEAACSR